MATHKLPAAAGMEQASVLLRELDAALAGAGQEGLTIDASALTEFDTSALALMLHARRVAQARSVALRVSGAPPKLRELAQLYGVEDLLALVDVGAT